MITRTIVNLREYASTTEESQSLRKKHGWSKAILRSISYMLTLLFLLFAVSPIYEAEAASLSVKIDGVSSNYTGKQVYVTLNGKKVSMKSTPGIVVNGTSYVSYKNVFGDSKIGATVSYNSKKKTITIKKYDKTLVMTLGSTKATLNGAVVTMPGAPIKVTYVAKNVTKILVPTEFVAKALGYEYSWTSTSDTVTAAIADGLVVKYDGKTYAYTGTKPNVTIDGTTVNLSTLPAIIIDNSVMFQAKKVYTSSSIGAKYKYDKTTKTVTLTTDDTVIQFTLGSTQAVVNGTTQEMPTAARMIKNVITGKSYVCVPGEFTSKALGLTYQWDSTTKTSVIVSGNDTEEDTTTEDESTSGGNTTTDSNTTTDNNSGTTTENNSGSTSTDDTTADSTTNGTTGTDTTVTSKVLNTYQILNDYYNTYTSLKNGVVTNFSSTGNGMAGYITNITRLADSRTDREIYQIQSQQPFSDVTSSQTDNVISITAANTTGASTLYPFYSDLLTSVQTIYNTDSNSMDFQFTVTNKNLSYEMELSADLCTLIVTIYTNYIESVEIGTNATGEYITIKSLKAIEPSLVASDTTLTLMVNNTMNSVGEISYTSSELTKITGLSCMAMNNNDFMMIVNRTSQAEYTVTQENETTYTITFKVDGSSSTTTDDTSTGDSSTGTTSGSTSTGATASSLSYTAVTIPMPSGMTIDSVTNEDLYLSKQIKLYLPGDQTSIISESSITKNSSYVSNVAVAYTNGETVITLTTTRICGFDYILKDGSLCVAIDTPSKVYNKIVVLDPGHGGSDTGAISSTKVNEKDINYKILYTIGKQLFADSGIKTYYTRTTDSAVNLYNRPKFSAEVEADLFISLHMNSATNTTAKGTEVYYYASETSTMNGLTGKIMATTFSSNLSTIMETTNRGAKSTANLVVLKYNTVPSVLIELGFMSNSSDLAKLVDSTYQKKAAQSIVATVCEFFDDYPTGR